MKKVFLKILQNSLGNTCARVSFDKVAVLGTPIKNILLRAPVQNTRERLLQDSFCTNIQILDQQILSP